MSSPDLPVLTLSHAPWLHDPAVLRLFEAAKARGGEIRFVGGCVRDALLGRLLGDHDLATTLQPQAVLDLAQALKIKAVPTGLAHGTVTLVMDGRPYEVTTLRRDVATDGRRAEVAFTDNWQDDAARRDFTMNALYCDADGRVYDYFGGLEDAKAGRVRFIGSPQARIREDVLRILRFFRFQAHYGQNGFDPRGLTACCELKDLLPTLSRERVHHELLKLLAARSPFVVWEEMQHSGIFEAMGLPFSANPTFAACVALEQELELEPQPLRRLWAALPEIFGSNKAALSEIAGALALSNKETARLVALAELDDLAPIATDCQALARLAYKVGAEAVSDGLIVHDLAEESVLTFLSKWKKPQFPLTGRDLEGLGVAQGPKMGQLLRAVEIWWISLDFSPNHAECLNRVKTSLNT